MKLKIPTFPGYEKQEDEAVAILLEGVGPDGGSADRKSFEALIRAAFRGGVVAVKTTPRDGTRTSLGRR